MVGVGGLPGVRPIGGKPGGGGAALGSVGVVADGGGLPGGDECAGGALVVTEDPGEGAVVGHRDALSGDAVVDPGGHRGWFGVHRDRDIRRGSIGAVISGEPQRVGPRHVERRRGVLRGGCAERDGPSRRRGHRGPRVDEWARCRVGIRRCGVQGDGVDRQGDRRCRGWRRPLVGQGSSGGWFSVSMGMLSSRGV